MSQPNPHDAFFRTVFGNPDNARDFLETVLPARLRRELNLSELRFDPEAHVSPDLSARYSDLVVKARLRRGGEAQVYILMEHKSSPDPGVLVQVMGYQLEIWRRELGAGKPLTPIIPLVFYHGKKRWRIPMRFEEQFDVPAALLPFIPKYRSLLFDTAGWDAGTAAGELLRGNAFLLTALLLLKETWRLDIPAIRKILAIWRELGYLGKEDQIFVELRYMALRTEIKPAELVGLLNETIKEEHLMPTLAEQWIMEGEVKGECLALQQTLIRLIEKKFGPGSVSVDRILACQNRERLQTALDAIITATDPAEVLAPLG